MFDWSRIASDELNPFTIRRGYILMGVISTGADDAALAEYRRRIELSACYSGSRVIEPWYMYGIVPACTKNLVELFQCIMVLNCRMEIMTL